MFAPYLAELPAWLLFLITWGQSAVSRSKYTDYSIAAIASLQEYYYNETSGLYTDLSWSGNAQGLTVLADFATLDFGDSVNLNLTHVYYKTYKKALTYHEGLVTSSYEDEGWWALALIHAYDVTGTYEFLSTAESLFKNIHNASDSVCGGGVWDTKAQANKSALANELYFTVAASLSNRGNNTTTQKKYYDIASSQWDWFKESGLINETGLITTSLSDSCLQTAVPSLSEIQGVLIGGLVEFVTAGANATELLPIATSLALATITNLSVDGILQDSCEPFCDSNLVSSKGVFFRNLRYLYSSNIDDSSARTIKTYVLLNAETLWKYARYSKNDTVGGDWTGPPSIGHGPNAGTQISAVDALLAAMTVH
ncbi:glycoside hydrolase [Lipomyces oligophaga]|uniref:glycoside hydrolase n=1 Tax=Lipomyces oligophaga TaxID=45792 RepID=UPI0034CD0B0C